MIQELSSCRHHSFFGLLSRV